MGIDIKKVFNLDSAVRVVFRRIISGSGKLLAANIFTGISGFVVLLLSSRVLGPDNYGKLGLALAFVNTTGTIISFQVWQIIIRYGARTIEDKNYSGFGELVLFGFSLDLTIAAISSVLAYSLAGLVVPVLKWSPELVPLIRIYCFALIFSVNSTPTGILRLFDRFDLLSLSNILNGLVSLLGIGYCVLTHQSLSGFISVNLTVVVFGRMFLIIFALLELKKRNIHFDSLRVDYKNIGKKHPGIWTYVWTTNLNSTVRMISRDTDLIIISLWVPPAGVGFYKLAKQMANIFGMLIDPLYQTVFPELSKLWARKDFSTFGSLIQKSLVLSASIMIPGWIAYAALGKPVLGLLLGARYVGVYSVALIYLIGTLISLCTFPFQPAMLAMGHPEKSLIALSISAAIYIGSLVLIVPTFGVNGASAAYILYYITWAVIMLFYMSRYYKQELGQGSLRPLQNQDEAPARITD